jgi:hypothetical protein
MNLIEINVSIFLVYFFLFTFSVLSKECERQRMFGFLSRECYSDTSHTLSGVIGRDAHPAEFIS